MSSNYVPFFVYLRMLQASAPPSDIIASAMATDQLLDFGFGSSAPATGGGSTQVLTVTKNYNNQPKISKWRRFLTHV